MERGGLVEPVAVHACCLAIVPISSANYRGQSPVMLATSSVPKRKLLAKSSAPLFISAQPEAIGEEQRKFIKESFINASRAQPIAEPIDWLTNPFPTTWLLDRQPVEFDWS